MNDLSTPTRAKVTNNLIWKLLERFGSQGVTFIVSVVLARLLDPAVYGTIALVTVFTTLLNVFVDSGLGVALVQKKESDDLDFSTVFFFNILLSLALYGVMFLAAPLVAHFYEMPELTPIIRVLSLIVVVGGMRNVQQSYVSKHLLFRKFFYATLGGTILSAIIGIYMAYQGYGVWALVGQTLSNNFVGTLILWCVVKWRPKWMFSWGRLKSLWKYGWKLLVSALIDTLYNDLRTLIIGKKYSENDLAYYNKGKTFPALIVTNVNNSIDSVLLPAMAKEQDDKVRVRAMTRRSISTSSFIMWPMMIGLMVCAEPVVRLLLTEKWMDSVLFMRVFCFTYAFYPIHTANLNAIKAVGRSDLFLKMEIAKKVVGISAIAITMWFGVDWMAYSLIITTFISQFINSYPNKKLLGYSYGQQLKDIFPSLALAAVMGICVYPIQFLRLHDAITLLIQVSLGVLIYVGGAKLLRFEAFEYLLSTVKKLFKRKPKEIQNEQTPES